MFPWGSTGKASSTSGMKDCAGQRHTYNLQPRVKIHLLRPSLSHSLPATYKGTLSCELPQCLSSKLVDDSFKDRSSRFLNSTSTPLQWIPWVSSWSPKVTPDKKTLLFYEIHLLHRGEIHNLRSSYLFTCDIFGGLVLLTAYRWSFSSWRCFIQGWVHLTNNLNPLNLLTTV